MLTSDTDIAHAACIPAAFSDPASFHTDTSHAPVYDVLIAGAGPTGLLLACELRMAACSVMVLEKAAQPHSPLKAAPLGMRGLSASTIDSLDRRGLLAPLRQRMARADAHGPQQRRPVGHFAGIDFFADQIDAAAWAYRLPVAIDTEAADMASIEAVLTARAEELGVNLRRGVAVDGLHQEAQGVTVQSGDEFFRGRWLVGCDGGRSAVRKLAGIGFAGTEAQFTGYSVQLSLADPAALEAGRHLTMGGVYIYAPPGALWMADFDGGASHRSVEMTRAHVETVLRKVAQRDVAVTALHLASTWTDRSLLAGAYRHGRVLLAGDAAHIHSPLGGQGLNLGIGDAMNLGWKLAAVVRDQAAPALLDSYKRERRPVAADVLERSRAQVALLRPDHGARALEAIMRELIDTRDGATYFAERVTGIGLRYARGDAHPLVGRSVPDFALDDGSRVNQRLRGGRGLLLDFGADPALQAFAGRAGAGLAYVAAAPEPSFGLAAAIVRPDGVVAWASNGAPDLARAEQAVHDWCAAGVQQGGLP